MFSSACYTYQVENTMKNITPVSKKVIAGKSVKNKNERKQGNCVAGGFMQTAAARCTQVLLMPVSEIQLAVSLCPSLLLVLLYTRSSRVLCVSQTYPLSDQIPKETRQRIFVLSSCFRGLSLWWQPGCSKTEPFIPW